MSTLERVRTGTDDVLEQTCPTLPDENVEAGARTLFVVCRGRTTEHPLPDTGVVIVGRGHDADVRVDHPTLSRRHLKLTLGARVIVQDNQSRNGTLIEGRMLAAGELAVVGPNMTIEAGDALLIVRRSTMTSGVVDVVTPTERIDAEVSLVRALLRIADAEVSVHLFGERGSGKTYLARRVHALSRRSHGPLVELDCTRPAAGVDIAATASAARGGVLIVHEPAALSPVDQTVLAETIASEGNAIRLATIARRDLAELVAQHALSPELARRLAGVSIVVPPLRERLDELPGIVETLVIEIASGNGRPVPRVAPEALAALARHSWPGNIRELENVLTRAVLACRIHVITAADVELGAPIAARDTNTSGAVSMTATAAERRRIAEALRACHGNQTRAAQMLGISRGTLIARLERFGLPRPRK